MIEYTELAKGVWDVTCQNTIIGGMSALAAETSETGWNVVAIDHTGTEPTPIPGSPFASVNQAKAAMEYHFRNLTEAA